jgi:hypothetical protein
MLVTLSGKAHAGKSEVAKVLIKHFSFVEHTLAYTLKRMCETVFFMSEYDTEDPVGKETPFDKPIQVDADHVIDLLMYLKFQLGLQLAQETKDIIRESMLALPPLVSPRKVLQFIGTEVLRKALGEDVHVDFWERQFKKNPSKEVVVTDVRFSNEKKYFQIKGGLQILVLDGTENEGVITHKSELGWDKKEFDLIFFNDKKLGLKALEEQILSYAKFHIKPTCLNTCP